MKKLTTILLLTFVFAALAPMSVVAQDDATDAKACVVISTWKDCSTYCTGAICYQFKNNCTYKVKVVWESKNPDGTWTKGELDLDPNEESAEAMFCPYIEMKWSYSKS